MPKIDKVELEKRIRIVQEWLIDDWAPIDIRAQILLKWDVEERQAKRYVALARSRWNGDEDEKVDMLRRRKIQKLQKLARTLKDAHKGTPSGMMALLKIEREIITLEGIRPATKLELTGKDGKELPPSSPAPTIIINQIGGSTLEIKENED